MPEPAQARDGDDGHAAGVSAGEIEPAPRDLGPARSIAEDTLSYLPRLVGRALEDLHAIALSVRVLPEVARSLGAIEASVDSMDREVKLMRQGVERVDADVVKVADAVGPLDAKLDDLRRTLRPLSRAAGRLGLRRNSD
jgi:hypothetical protein